MMRIWKSMPDSLRTVNLKKTLLKNKMKRLLDPCHLHNQYHTGSCLPRKHLRHCRNRKVG